jgi:hypothetical protein
MGWGTFLVGFGWTPAFHPICNECLIGGGGFLTDFGDGFSTTRDAGLQLFVPIKAVNGMLKMALLRPSPSSLAIGANPAVLQLPTLAGSGFNALGNDVDTSIPKLEASLSSAFGPLSFIVSGGFNTFKAVNTTTNNELKIDSWIAQASGSYSAGPFYAKGIGYFGQNLAVYGSPPVPFSIMEIFPSTYDGGQSVSDVDHWGFFGVAGFKFNDMISVEAGWGMKNVSMDKSTGGTIEVEKSAFVLFVPISITPAFVITPEILITDWGSFKQTGQPDIDRGGRNYYGVYWRIDF